MSCCLIVSGGCYVGKKSLKGKYDYIIACDKGFDHTISYKIKPDLVVGDFDSVSEENYKKIEKGKVKVIRFPKEKDDTDTMIAIKEALKLGYKSIDMICALGNRTDHTLANIQSAYYAVKKGATVKILGENEELTFFKDKSMEFCGENASVISVLSLGDKCEGVSISGTKYEAEDIELTGSFPLGISNEFVKKTAVVSVKNGSLMVIVSFKTS
ncbi:MAG: thiamine diphosphokinase [Lachnospiraceae bacterium]|nr:thiamine diphosphokinase [Lachnospiraceae bacterium]